jgi:tetratricopeptide (TPR) repeat protein
MNKNEKPPQHAKSKLKSSFSLKKISAFIGLIGVIIGALVGGSKIIQQVRQSREIKKEVKIFLEVGDRFAELFELNKAIEEYQKALELDEDNIDAHRRIITAMRQKIELKKFSGIESFPEINDILSRIYRVQALSSHLRNDFKLLLEEVRLLIDNNSWRDALSVLERALKVAPEEPEVLALFGFVRSLTSPKDKVEGLDLLVRAIESQPNKAIYHYYLAQALEHAQDDAESIREYYQAAKLLTGQDIRSYRLHNKAIKKLDNIFIRFFRKDGALTSRLNMAIDERAVIYEYLIAEYEKLPSKFRDLAESRTGYMAMLYYGLGDYEKADREIQKTFDYWHISYKDAIESWKTRTKTIPWIELHIKILQEGGLDPNTLTDARNYLKSYYDEKKRSEEAEKYRKILEVLRHGTYGQRYKVGLKVLNRKSDEGILVLHVFEEYPFAKAGVREGDSILEFSHRKVHRFYDIERILVEFKLGDNIPVKVKRGSEIMFLNLIIE